MTTAEKELVMLVDAYLEKAAMPTMFKYPKDNPTDEEKLDAIISAAWDLAGGYDSWFTSDFIETFGFDANGSDPVFPDFTNLNYFSNYKVKSNQELPGPHVIIQTLAEGFLCVALNWKEGFRRFNHYMENHGRRYYSIYKTNHYNGTNIVLNKDEFKELVGLVIKKASEDKANFDSFYTWVIIPYKIGG